MPTTQSNTHSNARRGGEHIAGDARSLIEENIGRENLDAALGLLQSVRDLGVRGFRKTTSYAQRHPVQFTAIAVGLGVLGSVLMKSRRKETLH